MTLGNCNVMLRVSKERPPAGGATALNVSRQARHVARIFERGGLLASEASKLRQGCGGAAPSGVKGRSPPEIFEKYGVVHDFWQ